MSKSISQSQNKIEYDEQLNERLVKIYEEGKANNFKGYDPDEVFSEIVEQIENSTVDAL